MVAPGGSPDADRFRPLRSGRSTSSLINALLIQKSIVPPFLFAFQISHSQCQMFRFDPILPRRDVSMSSLRIARRQNSRAKNNRHGSLLALRLRGRYNFAMPRKPRGDSTLETLLKLAGIAASVLKNPSGRRVRSDVRLKQLRKRSGK